MDEAEQEELFELIWTAQFSAMMMLRGGPNFVQMTEEQIKELLAALYNAGDQITCWQKIRIKKFIELMEKLPMREDIANMTTQEKRQLIADFDEAYTAANDLSFFYMVEGFIELDEDSLDLLMCEKYLSRLYSIESEVYFIRFELIMNDLPYSKDIEDPDEIYPLFLKAQDAYYYNRRPVPSPKPPVYYTGSSFNREIMEKYFGLYIYFCFNDAYEFINLADTLPSLADLRSMNSSERKAAGTEVINQFKTMKELFYSLRDKWGYDWFDVWLYDTSYMLRYLMCEARYMPYVIEAVDISVRIDALPSISDVQNMSPEDRDELKTTVILFIDEVDKFFNALEELYWTDEWSSYDQQIKIYQILTEEHGEKLYSLLHHLRSYDVDRILEVVGEIPSLEELAEMPQAEREVWRNQAIEKFEAIYDLLETLPEEFITDELIRKVGMLWSYPYYVNALAIKDLIDVLPSLEEAMEMSQDELEALYPHVREAVIAVNGAIYSADKSKSLL